MDAAAEKAKLAAEAEAAELAAALATIRELEHEAKRQAEDAFVLNAVASRHTPAEALFNRFYGSSCLHLQREGRAYMLELLDDGREELPDGALARTTHYHALPEQIQGRMTLWDMHMSADAYRSVLTADSSDSEDEAHAAAEFERAFDARTAAETHAYGSKSELLARLQLLTTVGAYVAAVD